MNQLVWTFSEEPSNDVITEVRDRLAAWNISASGIAGERWLAALVRDGAGDLMGGAVGRVWGAVLELRFLWVHETLHGCGIGSKLLEQIEQHGAGMGCKSGSADRYLRTDHAHLSQRHADASLEGFDRAQGIPHPDRHLSAATHVQALLFEEI